MRKGWNGSNVSGPRVPSDARGQVEWKLSGLARLPFPFSFIFFVVCFFLLFVLRPACSPPSFQPSPHSPFLLALRVAAGLCGALRVQRTVKQASESRRSAERTGKEPRLARAGLHRDDSPTYGAERVMHGRAVHVHKNSSNAGWRGSNEKPSSRFSRRPASPFRFFLHATASGSAAVRMPVFELLWRRMRRRCNGRTLGQP